MSRNSFLKKNKLQLLKKPLVVGTVTGQGLLAKQLQLAKKAQVDLLEVRLDTFGQVNRPLDQAILYSKTLLSQIKKISKRPILLTLRANDESGRPKSFSNSLIDKKRLSILKEVLFLANLVDIEIRSPLVSPVTRLAHQLRVDVIHSTHDFRGIGKQSTLKKLCKKSVKLHGDIFKVAVNPHTYEELETFFKWGIGLKHPRPVFIGMGKTGKMSRSIGYSFGSIMSFGHLGSSTAPGQPSVAELTKRITSIYGN